jgi:hypothetical protein
MHIYAIVNSESLNPFEPSMLDEEEESGPNLQTFEDMVTNTQTKLLHDTTLQRNVQIFREGPREYL